MVYSSSRTQKVVSLSSAEAETHAAASVVMDAILVHSIFAWLLQCHMVICLYLDSSAARGILSRKGVGRLRHLSCRVLWLQDLVAEKKLMVKAVLGAINPADIATKRLSAPRVESLSYFLGLWCGSNNSLVGTWDPANIFRHVNLPSRNQVRQLMSTLSALGALSQLTQLQGCTSVNFTTFPCAMDVLGFDAEFLVKLMITLLVILFGYGAYI